MRPMGSGGLRIEASASASLLLHVMPGMQALVERTFTEMFESALELRKLHGAFAADDRFLRMRVGDYVVSYLLDVDAALVRIMLIEPVRRLDE